MFILRQKWILISTILMFKMALLVSRNRGSWYCAVTTVQCLKLARWYERIWKKIRVVQILSCFWWRSRLRHCATSRKVAGSIADGVIGIFHWHDPCGRAMALGSTQPRREMSTRNTGWLKNIDSISYVYISWTLHGMWMIYITFERGGPKFLNTIARAFA